MFSLRMGICHPASGNSHSDGKDREVNRWRLQSAVRAVVDGFLVGNEKAAIMVRHLAVGHSEAGCRVPRENVLALLKNSFLF